MSTALLTAPLQQPSTSDPAKAAGRTVGALVFLHLVLGMMLPFMLIDTIRNAGFLAHAAAMANQVRAAVLLLFVGSALEIAITVAAWPVLRRYTSAMALWLLALSVAAFSLQAVDNAHLLSIVSLSQEYAKAGPASTDLFQALALVAFSARKWAHYSFLLVAVVWMFLLFAALFRFRLVPRVLAGYGMAAALLQIGGVTMFALFGNPPQTLVAGTPLAPAYLGLAGWLMVKGFPADSSGR